MNDQQLESELKAKGLTAPRVTPADIEANIASEHFFTAADGVMESGLSEIKGGARSIDAIEQPRRVG